jgi:hypothetical protein
MQSIKSLDWKAIAAALAALGIVTSADPQLAAISIAGMMIVTLLNFLARSFGVRVTAGWLTIFLYAVSTGIAVLLNPVSVPAWPVYAGDPAVYLLTIVEFVENTAPIATSITAAATLVYNALKPLVWDKVLPVVDDIGETAG